MDNKSSKVTNWGIVKSGMQAIHLLKVLNEPSSLNKTMGQLLNETYTDYTDLRILNKDFKVFFSIIECYFGGQRSLFFLFANLKRDSHSAFLR